MINLTSLSADDIFNIGVPLHKDDKVTAKQKFGNDTSEPSPLGIKVKISLQYGLILERLKSLML